MATILLRSSWQTVNIGDIAHTPGMLRLLEQYLPNVEVILWPSNVGRGVEPMLRRRFPKLRFVRDGAANLETPRAEDPTVAQAIAKADLLLHGSGPSLVGLKEIQRAKQSPWIS